MLWTIIMMKSNGARERNIDGAANERTERKVSINV